VYTLFNYRYVPAGSSAAFPIISDCCHDGIHHKYFTST